MSSNLCDLPSFPTRRSSDLLRTDHHQIRLRRVGETVIGSDGESVPAAPARLYRCPRSEEHTSELQSRRELVCRLLLEKKKIHRMVVCTSHIVYGTMSK